MKAKSSRSTELRSNGLGSNGHGSSGYESTGFRSTVLKSTRVRILAWVLVPVVMVLVLTLATSWTMLITDKQAEIDDHLSREATELALLATEGIDPVTSKPFASAESLLNLYISRTMTDNNETMFIVVDGQPVARTSDNPVTRLDRDNEFLTLVNTKTTTTLSSYESEVGTIRYIVVPVVTDLDSGALVGIIFQDLEFQAVRDMIARLALIVLLALLSAAAVGWIVAGRVLRPISHLRDAAHQINESDLNRTIDAAGSGTELEELAQEFNLMLARLQESFEVQRQFVDDAGHELRTPLTVISGHFDLIEADPSQRDASMLIIRDELERMSRMVRDLQALTRSNQSDFIKVAQANLSDLADALFVKASALADRDFSLAVQDKASSKQAADPATNQATSWVLDEQRITQAVLQLVSNAVSHTTQGQEIRITISHKADQLEIAVEDAGSGIPLEARDRVTKRFSRGSEAARKGEGAGLGLALVSAIATAHGGELAITDSDLGGARVALLLPA